MEPQMPFLPPPPPPPPAPYQGTIDGPARTPEEVAELEKSLPPAPLEPDAPPPPPEPIEIEKESATVHGWATFRSGPTARVEIFFDDEPLGNARTGVARPDVVEIFDEPYAEVSGFELDVSAAKLCAGKDRAGSFRAVAYAVDGNRNELDPLPVILHPPEVPEAVAAEVAPPPAPIAFARRGGPRALVITHQLTLGGAQLYLMDVLREQLRLGLIDPIVISTIDGPLREELEQLGVPVHVTSLVPPGKLSSQRGRLEEFMTWVRPLDPELVFINTSTSATFVGGEIAVALGIPSVWAIHESFEPAQLWADLVPEVRAHAEAVIGTASAAIFEADATRHIYEGLIDPGRCQTIPYGLALEPIDALRADFDPAAARRQAGVPTDARLVVCVGTVEPRKAQVPLAIAFGLIAVPPPGQPPRLHRRPRGRPFHRRARRLHRDLAATRPDGGDPDHARRRRLVRHGRPPGLRLRCRVAAADGARGDGLGHAGPGDGRVRHPGADRRQRDRLALRSARRRRPRRRPRPGAERPRVHLRRDRAEGPSPRRGPPFPERICGSDVRGIRRRDRQERPGQVKPAFRWGLVVLGVALLLFALDFWWFHAHRGGYPFDIDEAGYTAFGISDYLGGHFGGISGWWEAIQNQPTFAPLLPALTSVTVLIHPGILNGFAVLGVFAIVLALAAYGVASRLAGPRLGAFAAIVTATLPGTILFTREYIFALPTTAFLMLSVYAALRSDGLRSWLWSIGCGVALGLMLLSRTMAVAFVPGVILAAVVPMAIRGGRRELGRRLLNLVLLIVAGTAVAATWYAKNIGSVYDYLTNYGYGHQAKFYGAQHATISWGRFRGVGERMIGEDLFLPMAIAFLLALGTLLYLAVRAIRGSSTRRATLERIAGSDGFAVCIVFIVGYAALMSSRNGGDGFSIPISALLPSICVMALRRFPKATVPTVAVVGVVAIVNVVSLSTFWNWASGAVYVHVPGVPEALPLTKGEPKAVFAIRQEFPGPESHFNQRDSLWLRADRKLAGTINAHYGPNGEAPVVAFASRNRALNANTVQLAGITKYQRGLPLEQFEIEEEKEDTVANYRELLEDGGAGAATLLITTSSEENDFAIPITQSKAVAAARSLSFKTVATMKLPDGRTLYVWERSSPIRSG